MAAYAEGLNLLAHANIGNAEHAVDAETTPVRDPDHYRYDIDTAKVSEAWRRGTVIRSWLLDLTAAALADDPELGHLAGRVSDSGEGRWTAAGGDRHRHAHAGPDARAAGALQLARRGRLRRPPAVGDARAVRRAPREAGRAGPAHEPARTGRRARHLRDDGGPGLPPDLPGAPAHGPGRGPQRPRRRRRPRALEPRQAAPAREGEPGGEHGRGSTRRRSRSSARSCATRAATYDDPKTYGELATELDGCERPVHYLAIPPKLFATAVGHLGSAGLRRARPGRRREAVRARPRVGARAERRAAAGLPRGARLPHRPLPREDAGRQHPVLPLREHVPRAGLEPPVRQADPDHDGRDARRRQPRRLLRRRRRGPRRHREPPLPGAHAARDGPVPRPSRRRAAQGEGALPARRPRAAPAGRRPRPVPRLPPDRRRRARLEGRDVRRDAPARRHLALGGRSDPRPRGQVPPREGDRGRHRAEEAAGEALPPAAPARQPHALPDRPRRR